jgi:hypothetical protein
VATSDGAAYTGRFARVGRFFLAAAEASRVERPRQPWYLRLLAEDGTLLAVEDLDSRHRVGRLVTLARGHLGRTRWRLTANAQRMLDPLPGDEERFKRTVCVTLRSSPFGGGQGSCFDPVTDTGFDSPGYSVDCRGLGTTVLVSVPAGVLSAVAVLGSGRRLRLPTHLLPRRFGGGRWVAAVLGKRIAVRRLEFLDRRGRRLRSVHMRLPPAQLGCSASAGISLFGTIDPDRTDRVPGGAKPALQVTDRGELLCVSLAGTPASAVFCREPPVAAYESRILTLPVAGATFVAGVVPVDAARVELELDGARRQPVMTTLAGGYRGRWAGKVRFFTIRVPGHVALTATRLSDSRGRHIATIGGPDGAPFERPPRPLLRMRPGVQLNAGIIARSTQGRRGLCVSLSRRVPSSDHCQEAFLPRSLLVSAACRPRVLVVWGAVPVGIRALRLTTTRGTRRGRLRRLPRGFGIKRKLVLLTAPANATPRELLLVLRAGRVKRVRVHLSSARRQCGFTGSVAIGRSFP